MFSTFWSFLWSTLVIFAVIAYLMIMSTILVDLFWRDRSTSGIVKAIWVVALVVLPYLTALVYLIVRGEGMAERAADRAASEQQRAEDYIRENTGRSTVQEIAEAKKLFDEGAITKTEFERLKSAAFAE